MLTRLRFKNWRSLKDVEIPDLTPITVFIGANSSGKTNIVSGLHFLHQALNLNERQSAIFRAQREKLATLGATEQKLSLEIAYRHAIETPLLDYKIEIGLSENDTYLEERVIDSLQQVYLHGRNGSGSFIDQQIGIDDETGFLLRLASGLYRMFPDKLGGVTQLSNFVVNRWQLLEENFMPPTTPINTEAMSIFSIDKCADNVPAILEFLRIDYRETYEKLQDDLKWLLGHVDSIDTENTEWETRFFVREKIHSGQEAPTISAGTARIVAMLAAYYALDMRHTSTPGLVVIEEPDTALNPGLLGRFVELLRTYTERKDAPRQFILTTHNPTLLDYFQPEEVRVVERDENGYTQVNKIPDHIKDIWLDEYGLGEVWMTNSFGGKPE